MRSRYRFQDVGPAVVATNDDLVDAVIVIAGIALVALAVALLRRLGEEALMGRKPSLDR